MAYRRRHGITRASTFTEETRRDGDVFSSSSSPSSSLLSHSSSFSGSSPYSAQSIHASPSPSSSAAHRDSSISTPSAVSPADPSKSKGPARYEYTSMNIPNESKHGFWGVLARKAKAILEEDNGLQNFESQDIKRTQIPETSTDSQIRQPYQPSQNNRNIENPRIRKGLDAITSSLNHIGDTLGNAFEEGRSIVENKTADIIQETRKLQIRRKGNSEESNQASGLQVQGQWQPPEQLRLRPNQENQIKASRDVAMATAAKAKLLLRELKTVKADLAFAKERCAQLEDENKILRESRGKGDNPADDDLIRLQLETLLAEKARLARENSVYARENRFLREIVEYHQLTTQDVVCLDEGIEEVTEVYPISKMLSICSPSSSSPPSPLDMDEALSSPVTNEVSLPHSQSQEDMPVAEGQALSNSTLPGSSAEDSSRQPAYA